MISQVRNYKYAQDSHFDTWWVEDGSFIRGQNFILGYTVPTSSSKAKIQKLRFYVSVQNLFLITDYTGYDPEVGSYVGGNANAGNQAIGLDYGRYPLTPIYTFSLGVNF